ncbi:trans-aconitate 2-methyltransferase [Gramella sp. KN1008]|uniref:class I SAM-dependent methyltransferase n=1 Tax=Gramella sp. KN1008 TaxID=2529298 RepID=UPI00103A2155|nr:class I SAM-dependent methyltransferase [Gramella sp. KN1008]TBW30030.1 class I SAM-dependent methyltransferase [Gramella sp. KN1008]
MKEMENTRRIFNKYAEGYQDKYMDVSLYHDSLNLFCENLNEKQTRILEIGCGPGNLTTYLITQRPDLKILGIDIAERMIKLARNNNPRAEFRVLDCRKIEGLEDKYDAVVCGFCLPYLTKKEALKLIDDISALLNPGGVIYLSTMEADHNRSGYEGSDSNDEKLYINYHEASYLREALGNNNFEITKVCRIANSNNQSHINDLVFIASK